MPLRRVKPAPFPDHAVSGRGFLEVSPIKFNSIARHGARPQARSFSRREQRRNSEPVRGSTQHPLRRERDGEEPLFRAGGRNQLKPDRHADAIASTAS